MKRTTLYAATLLIAGSLAMSSCIGSFGLWNNLRNWNLGLGNKFANEVVFLAFHIIPVYPIAYMADILVLNSIEFWTGENPVTAEIGKTREVKGQDGKDYLVTTREDGYTIACKDEPGKEMNLVYDKASSTWNVAEGDKLVPIFRTNANGTITVEPANEAPITITPDATGLAALRMATR